MNLKQYQKLKAAFEAPDPSDGPDIRQRLTESDGEFIFYDGFDLAIVGTVERCSASAVVCYSRDRIAAILMIRDGMTREESEEFIDFNIAGGYLGPNTPMLLST